MTKPSISGETEVELPKLEEDILAILSGTEEFCYNYDALVGTIGVSRKYLEPAIKHLRENQYITHWKGLMTDDGEVAGSGWCRSSKGNDYVEEHNL